MYILNYILKKRYSLTTCYKFLFQECIYHAYLTQSLINPFVTYSYFLFLFEFKLISNIKHDYIIDACHGKLCKDVNQLA